MAGRDCQNRFVIPSPEKSHPSTSAGSRVLFPSATVYPRARQKLFSSLSVTPPPPSNGNSGSVQQGRTTIAVPRRRSALPQVLLLWRCCGVQVNCRAVCLLCRRAIATVHDHRRQTMLSRAARLSPSPELRAAAPPRPCQRGCSSCCCPKLFIRSIAPTNMEHQQRDLSYYSNTAGQTLQCHILYNRSILRIEDVHRWKWTSYFRATFQFLPFN